MDWIYYSRAEIQRIVPAGPLGLLVIGIDGCGACDFLKIGAELFSKKYPDSNIIFAKISKADWGKGKVRIWGKEIRYYPTAIGFFNKLEIFRIEGAAVKRNDLVILEKKFNLLNI